ncbi:MAG TPA: hypothetical protein VFJ74_08290 [Gemmatimonadaceae bacterium]|nr:hypothetical protein [Gemmatimonadaceae bacterium]
MIILSHARSLAAVFTLASTVIQIDERGVANGEATTSQRDPVVATSQSPLPTPRLPVLNFPEPGLDDSAAYQGYRTRFYRDSKGNSVQLYVDERSGRVVQVWADAANESIGFTARDATGKPARVAWGGDTAWVSDSGSGARTLAYRLAADAPSVEIGWFVLGTMRVERDVQYWKVHLRPYSAPRFRVAEESTLVAAVERLPAAEQRRHLAELRAPSVAALRARLEPSIVVRSAGGLTTCARVARPSLDGRNQLALELCVPSRDAALRSTGRTVVVTARPGRHVVLAVRTTTDAAPLTPIAREEIFNRAFLDFLDGARAAGRDSASTARYRRLEREVRSVELLSSREKLMAGMPNYATYFGRDQMMTALMMQPVWTPVMSEAVIASVLRKLSPTGHVSHEEALAGQAIREHAGEYVALVDSALGARGPARDSAMTRAVRVLGRLQETRENYNMLDGEFQLPVLVARYLDDPSVTADRKRAFLSTPEPQQHGRTRLFLLVRELGRMTALTAPYARSARADSLVAFVRLDSTHWRSASWRDSRAGYANGRFAMDINAIWAPEALRATERIFSSLRTLGVDIRAAMVGNSELTYWALADYGLDSAKLRRAADTWSGASRHFTVTLPPAEIAASVNAKLAWMEPAERAFWTQRAAAAGRDSLTFLALSLDSAARPIRVVNTDPATGLFLGNDGAAVVGGSLSADSAARRLDPFLRAYPVGLFIPEVGPAVANDAYASDSVWNAFREDSYHGPRVVWGREVNLLLLGLAKQLTTVESVNRTHTPAMDTYAAALHGAIDRVHAAVAASGFEHSELWSYRVDGGALRAERYGISSDLQLWSSADLAVQFMLARLGAAPR